jgi:hypothetical protein
VFNAHQQVQPHGSSHLQVCLDLNMGQWPKTPFLFALLCLGVFPVFKSGKSKDTGLTYHEFGILLCPIFSLSTTGIILDRSFDFKIQSFCTQFPPLLSNFIYIPSPLHRAPGNKRACGNLRFSAKLHSDHEMRFQRICSTRSSVSGWSPNAPRTQSS